MSTLVLRVAARLLSPPIVVLGLFFLWRGHDAPGGGFIAGLVLGAGIVLRWLAFGPDGIGWLLAAAPRTVIAVGLALSIGVGLAPLVLGDPFLSGAIWELRSFGVELKVTSSLMFDVGVALVVVGMVGAFVRGMGEQC